MKYTQQYTTMQGGISIEDHDDEFPNLLIVFREVIHERQDEMQLHDIDENGEAIRDKLNNLNANSSGIRMIAKRSRIKSIPRSGMLLRDHSNELTQVYRIDYAAEMIARKLNVSSTWRPNYTVMQCITMIREGNNEIQDYHNWTKYYKVKKGIKF